ncbi:MAG TPA: hypothetical protein VJS64_03115, partial [Pyrinomonadaceae bacterium]|nr:hypothetical protein [Pyrinomonadaceae bacterium]
LVRLPEPGPPPQRVLCSCWPNVGLANVLLLAYFITCVLITRAVVGAVYLPQLSDLPAWAGDVLVDAVFCRILRGGPQGRHLVCAYSNPC